jgi:ActR/RegA family two-component response regulator
VHWGVPGFEPRLGAPLENRIQLLVVEDEALLHMMLEETLKDGGFAVTITASGADAIAMLEAPDAAFRALIPVVYTSGGGVADWSANGVPNSLLVAKPFAPAQVVTAVSQLLNQGGTPGA